MQRRNRLAVFEHVPPKDKQPPKGSRSLKRGRSPEIIYNESRNERRRKNIKLSENNLDLNCEYENCGFNTKIYSKLLVHVGVHISENEDDILNLEYRCSWDNCGTIFPNLDNFKQHLYYHAYHSKLVVIGKSILSEISLPDCKEINVFRTPSFPNNYTCEWDNCNYILLSYPHFVNHVKCHVNALPTKCVDKNDVIKCGWTGCSNTYPFQYKLAEHVRCHTKEKVVACPTCGVMFSSRTKFIDHRKRQLAVELQGYQCSHCSKVFASERLLRDHMRVHINHYKCHLCDMTCTKPSALAKHIRYRHLPDRLFKCDICSHSTITFHDLEKHKKTHLEDTKLQCSHCDFKCRSKFTFEKHLKKHDGIWEYKYACHCCDKRFPRGALLTKHLIKIHDFHWPSGHSRFSYKQDAKTGLYHLRVVRYESLEVTKEMMEGHIPYDFETGKNCKFTCEKAPDKPLSYVLKLDNEDMNDDTSLPKYSQLSQCDIKNKREVVITIKDVDGKGNVKIDRVEKGKILLPSEIEDADYQSIILN